MSILSIEFIAFVMGVALLYYAVPVCVRWWVLLAASLVFYALAGGQGMICLALVAGLTYGGALGVARFRDGKSKWILACVLVITLGMLGFFRYFPLGGLTDIQLIVPLGISYFTFQSIGYLIDVYREKYPPERNPLKYLLFVSFFPQMTQGPISAWPQLSGQLTEGHRFEPDRFVSGMTLMLWGFFRKLVIGDRIAPFVAQIAAKPGEYPGWMILLAAIAYSLQLYADFSGGMDIIRGVARLLGIELTENFRRPFFAVSAADYWRRWHISLGAWFRSYLFYPLTTSHAGLALMRASQKAFGKKVGRAVPAALATVIIFLVIGIWHTASWNAVLYGLYFGGILGGALLLEPGFRAVKKKLRIREKAWSWKAFGMVRTWAVILIAQYFAFSLNTKAVFQMFGRTVFHFGWDSFLAFSKVPAFAFAPLEGVIAFIALGLMLLVDVLGERGFRLADRVTHMPLVLPWVVLLFLSFSVLIFGRYGQGFDSVAFMYAQF